MSTENDFEEDLFADEDEESLPAEESLPEEDAALFVATNIQKKPPTDTWKVLVVDDEDDVHQMTKVVLDDFIFENKPLEILNVNSAKEAKQILAEYPDIAVILLDVVMETSDAGLNLVGYIRKTLKNRFVRIVLRTGQPGYAPEKEVIRKYDINDYTTFRRKS